MKKVSIVLGAMAFLSAPSSWAASFDCAKARSPLEKLICRTPELDAADARMGEIYKAVNKSFPLPGFIASNQRMFLRDYSDCMSSNNSGKPLSTLAAVKNCVGMVQERIAALERFANSKVYSDVKGKFSPEESLVILTYNVQGVNTIHLWGNWMPDAYDPKPFPDGKICHLEGPLTPAKGGFITSLTGDAVFLITDASVKITEYISCTPRNGIGAGEYKRIK